MRSDLEIAQSIPLIPITEIAAHIGINDDELEPHGKYKAKISLQLLERLKDKPPKPSIEPKTAPLLFCHS